MTLFCSPQRSLCLRNRTSKGLERLYVAPGIVQACSRQACRSLLQCATCAHAAAGGRSETQQDTAAAVYSTVAQVNEVSSDPIAQPTQLHASTVQGTYSSTSLAAAIAVGAAASSGNRNGSNSAVVNLARRRRQRQQHGRADEPEPQQQSDPAAHSSARQQQRSSHSHQQQRQQLPQQHQRNQHQLQEDQLKPALQHLLQQMQEAHSSIQHQHLQQSQDHWLQGLKLQQSTAAVQLNQLIQRVSNPKQLLLILISGRGLLNVVHLTAVATALVKLVGHSQLMLQDPNYRNKVKVCYKQLRKVLEGQLLDFDPHGIASLLHCVAKLGCLDPHLRAQGLWGDLLHVSTSHMENFSPTQLAMLAHAAAKADPWALTKPSRRWWSEFYAATYAAMQLQQQRGQDAAKGNAQMTADALQQKRPVSKGHPVQPAGAANLGQQQQPQVEEGCEGQHASQSLAPQDAEGFTPQGLSNMVWAMGKLARRPGIDWAASLYRTTEPLLAGFSPQGLANMGSGLANMHAAGHLPRPDRTWIGKYLEAACAQTDGFSSQGMANLLWSLAKLGYCPSREQLTQIYPACQALLPRSSPQDLSLAVYSFAALAVKPPEMWWTLFWGASARAMDQASSQALANMFWAHGRLKKIPPSQWLLVFLPCLQQQLPQCSPQATSIVLWAAAQLKLQQLPGAWLDSVLDRVYQQLHCSECGAQELSLYVESLHQLQHKPSSKWLERFYAVSLHKLPAFSSKQLATTLAALGALSPDAVPPQPWASAAVRAVSARIVTLNAPGLCCIMWGLCQLRQMPDKDTLQRYLAQTAEKMHTMNGAMLSRTLYTLVCFGYKPNTDWLALLTDESHYYLPEMTPDQLADIVWSFGQLRYSPGLNWLTTAADTGLAKLSGFDSRSLVKLLTGLAVLRVKPAAQWLGAVGFRLQRLLRNMNGEELLQCIGALEQLGLAPVPLLVQQLMAGALKTPAAAEELAIAAAKSRQQAAASASLGQSAGSREIPLHEQQQWQEQNLAALGFLHQTASGAGAVAVGVPSSVGNGTGNVAANSQQKMQPQHFIAGDTAAAAAHAAASPASVIAHNNAEHGHQKEAAVPSASEHGDIGGAMTGARVAMQPALELPEAGAGPAAVTGTAATGPGTTAGGNVASSSQQQASSAAALLPKPALPRRTVHRSGAPFAASR